MKKGILVFPIWRLQMFYSAIELRQTEDSAMVAKIAAETIRAIYPRYYPAGAVEFFCRAS